MEQIVQNFHDEDMEDIKQQTINFHNNSSSLISSSSSYYNPCITRNRTSLNMGRCGGLVKDSCHNSDNGEDEDDDDDGNVNGGDGRDSAISGTNCCNINPIGDRTILPKYSQYNHQHHQNQNQDHPQNNTFYYNGACGGGGGGAGSDLNSSSMNSFNDTISPIPVHSNTVTISNNKILGTMTGRGRKNDGEKNSYLLWVVTPVAASISVAIVVAALAGPQWLFTEERVPNNSYAGIPIFDLENDEAFVTKYTKSSLWILCYTFQGMKSYNCVKIDCFPEEQYRPDPQDSTLAIPYTIVKSAPLFLVSGIFLLISFLVFLMAACTNQNSIYYFTAGILFIVSGLLMLIGLIAYISIFKAEIGSKLRPKSTLQPPPLKFTYGHSFFLYVFGFVSTEFVGVLNIFLFISLQQVGHYKTIPCLSFMSAEKKVKDMEASSANFRRLRLEDDDERLSRFICKKHSIPTNLLYANDTGRRYYFEKPVKCDLHHSKDLTKSLNELYTEPAPVFQCYELPLNHRQQHHQKHQLQQYQQQHQQYHHQTGYPLTRSVSTATEIFSNNNTNNNSNCTITNSNIGNSSIDDSKMIDKNNKKNQANISKEHLNDICGLSRGILAKGRKTKDELINEFCKKTGIRPKPKDIYYIDNDDDDDDVIVGVDINNREDRMDRDREGIFIIDDYNNMSFKKNRRNSYVEPRHRNSNSSLHSYDKTYPKSLFDLDRYDSDIWNNCHDYHLRRSTSKDKLNEYDHYSQNSSQSRTLPRCFMKRNFHLNDLSGHRNSFGYDGILKNEFRSNENLHKSFDDLNMANMSQRKITNNNNNNNNNLSVQWPTAIPTSPSNYSTKSAAYILSSSGDLSRYNSERKFNQGYSFDSNNSRQDIFDLFDLDKIERERRKSHASLFDVGYDMMNGTAV